MFEFPLAPSTAIVAQAVVPPIASNVIVAQALVAAPASSSTSQGPQLKGTVRPRYSFWKDGKRTRTVKPDGMPMSRGECISRARERKATNMCQALQVGLVRHTTAS